MLPTLIRAKAQPELLPKQIQFKCSRLPGRKEVEKWNI